MPRIIQPQIVIEIRHGSGFNNAVSLLDVIAGCSYLYLSTWKRPNKFPDDRFSQPAPHLSIATQWKWSHEMGWRMSAGLSLVDVDDGGSAQGQKTLRLWWRAWYDSEHTLMPTCFANQTDYMDPLDRQFIPQQISNTHAHTHTRTHVRT